jgi:hypothetical protein
VILEPRGVVCVLVKVTWVAGEQRRSVVVSSARDRWGGDMTQLHMRGVELVVELLDAAENVHLMKTEEIRRLLKDTASVLSDLLVRDIPPERRE